MEECRVRQDSDLNQPDRLGGFPAQVLSGVGESDSAPTRPLAPGTIRILGQSRYELREFVTKGGMGAVYRAWDHHLNRQVAVKCMLDVNREGSRDLASQEARTLAGLSHPNILRVYDILTEDEQVWIVSEWVDGACLEELLKKNDVLPEPVVMAVMAQIFSALSATHTSNVFHRDIKPANVMLGTNGQITLIDFGVAYSPGFSTGETLVGSLRYTDPRILEGAAPDARSDLFSAALLQMELMNGEKVLPDLAPLPLYRHMSKNLASRIAALGDGCLPSLTSLVARLALPSTQARDALPSISAQEASKYVTELLRQFTEETPERILASYLAGDPTSIDTACQKMRDAARSAIADQSTPAREKAAWISYLSSSAAPKDYEPKPGQQSRAHASLATVTRTLIQKNPAKRTFDAVRRSKWAELWLALVVIILAVAVLRFTNTDEPVPEVATPQPETVLPDLAAKPEALPTKTEEAPLTATKFPIHIVANAWANISVNGQKIGQIPSAKPFMLEAGTHSLHVESPFVEPLDLSIEVGPGKSEKIQLTLKAKLAPRVIKLNSPGQLFVDGVDYGVVESKALTLSYGTHEVVIKRGNQVIRPTATTIGPETPAEIRVEQ